MSFMFEASRNQMQRPAETTLPPVCFGLPGGWSRAVLTGGLLLASTYMSGATDELPLRTVWEALGRMEFQEANRKIEQVSPLDGDSGREIRYARAMLHLASEPRTQQKVSDAEAEFRGLFEAGLSDDTASDACYMVGRINELFARVSDSEEARRWYRKVLTESPASVAAEQAALRLIMLDIYDPGSPLEPAERIAAAENYGEYIRSGYLRRNMHFVLARSYLFFDLAPEKALEHLKSLLASPLRGSVGQRADNLVAAVQLAERVGAVALQTQYIQAFLHEYPRDARRSSIAALLK